MNNWASACVPSGHGSFQSLPMEDPPPWRGTSLSSHEFLDTVSEETKLPGVRADPQADG